MTFGQYFVATYFTGNKNMKKNFNNSKLNIQLGMINSPVFIHMRFECCEQTKF